MGNFVEFYKKSQLLNGKFGFNVIIYDGNVFYLVIWESIWVGFFCNFFLYVCNFDVQENEFWFEFEFVVKQMSEVVIL